MPSINPTPAAKQTLVDNDYLVNPMKPAITIVEHKVRNLEKRKAKLDQYKSEQDAGKELNADQLAAVAKYGEVMQQLEFARDMTKQLNQANEETRREIKKQRKAELVERTAAETEKIRTLFLIQAVIQELEKPDATRNINDNVDLEAWQRVLFSINNHPFMRFSEHLKIDESFDETLNMFATNWRELLDGSKRSVDGQSTKDRMTFKTIRDTFLDVANSEYFVNKRCKEVVAEEEEVHEDATNSDSESIPSTTANNPQQPIHVEPVISEPPATVSSTIQNSYYSQESTYSFLQDSQIDMESPHFDPAVVAVSSCVPGPINPHIDLQARNAFTITTSAPPQQFTATLSNGVGDMDYLQKHEHDQNQMPLMDDKITEWSSNDVGKKDNFEERNEMDDGQNYNRYGASNNRGRGRGFRSRGPSNGFSRGGGGSRGGRGREGFPNGRIGYFRSGDQQQQQDLNFESREFRASLRGGNGNNGYNDGTGRGNGRGNGGGFRGGRGSSQGNNFTSGGNNGGGYRGAPRGSRPPRTSENNGVNAAKCY